MAYAPINTATPSTGFNATLTPAMPSGFVAGNLLLLHTGEYQGSDPTPSVVGWTLLSPGVLANQVALFGRIAMGGDASPAITWGNQYSFAFVTAYSGNPSSLASIVHASADHLHSDEQFILYPALTITAPNCLVIAAGSRDKTTVSDGGTFDTYGSFTIRNTSIMTNPNPTPAGVLNDWIQTTPTSISAGFQTFTIADSVNMQNEGYIVALYPAGTPSNSAAISWAQ